MQPESPQSKPLQRVVDAKLVTMDANGFFFFSIELRLAETKFVFLKIYRSKLETTMVTNDDDDDDDDDVVVDDNHGLFIFHRSQTVCASHKRSAKPSLNLDPLLT